MYNILCYMKITAMERVYVSLKSIFSLPLSISNQLIFCYIDTTVIYFSVKLQLLSHYYTCNKVHVIPNLIYFITIYCCAYMLNSYLCLQSISFCSSARYTSIIFLQIGGAAFAFCFSMHTFIIFFRNGFSYTPLCHFHSLCVLVPLASILPCTLHSFPLWASFSLRTFISYLSKIHLS